MTIITREMMEKVKPVVVLEDGSVSVKTDFGEIVFPVSCNTPEKLDEIRGMGQVKKALH